MGGLIRAIQQFTFQKMWTMKQNEHRSGASAEEEDESSYIDSSEDESMSNNSNSVSHESGGEGSSFSSYEEESFTSSSASANGSDEESSYSSSSESSSQHSCDSNDDSDDNNISLDIHDDIIDSNDVARAINSRSPLIATTDSSNEASSSSARVVATNQSFQRGVLPISIRTNGDAGGIGANSNNVLTHRRGKKSLESNNISQSYPLHENEKMPNDNSSERITIPTGKEVQNVIGNIPNGIINRSKV